MAFNPFLSMNEVAAPVTSEALNPFGAPDADDDTFAGENPFAGSNPFADFGGYEPAVGDTVPIDLFGGPPPSIGNAAIQPPAKPQDLPLSPALPPRPLAPETQHLILTVTGQMDLTSNHLLDRIPPTRTPSPVSVRDIHSPSPTPEFDMEEDSQPPLQPLQQQPQSLAEASRSKPARPPPARPPPAARPPPPRPGPPPRPPQVQQQSDDINLFDAPVPTLVKPTKEAIMSLYSAPKKEEVKPIDFLSDDIPTSLSTAMDCSESATANNVFSASPFDNMDSHKMDVTNAIEDSLPTSVTGSPFGEAASINDTVVENKSSPSEVSAFGNEVTPFATETFSQENVTVNYSPFATDNDVSPALTNQTEIFTSALSPTENQTVPSSTDPQPFNNDTSEANTFTTATMSFTTQSSPFAVDSIYSNETTEHAIPCAVSAQPGESMIFGVDTKSVATADKFDSPLIDTSRVSNNDFPAFGSRRESEGNPFESAEDPYPSAAWGSASEIPEPMTQDTFPDTGNDAFDAFSAKFDSTVVNHVETDPWGAAAEAETADAGFESEAFDSFLNMQAPPPAPAATPYAASRASPDSEEDNFSLVIRPKEEGGIQAPVPVLAPPPKTMAEPPRVNPFFSRELGAGGEAGAGADAGARFGRERGPDSPPTPLFDEDVSLPLEPFPRTAYSGPGWEMQLRQPNKKKITGQRFWKKIFVRLVYQGDSPVVQLLNSATDKEPFQELPLQPCYSVSEVGAQQYDQFGKIFTVKLQYVFYKERPGVRPGQVTKAERLTTKLSAFAAYAIQGDYQGVKEFGSDLRKLGLPVEHAPQVSQLFKIGSLCHEDVLQFSSCVEEAMFRLQAHRDRALVYKMEEVQITAVDELYVEQDAEGGVIKQIARVRIFFLGFLNGMPDVEVGVNDLRRQGREVVGRHDIMPVVTEEWIRVEDAQFHACVQPAAFHDAQLLRFRPPDACYVEVCRFRVRPPRNRELPLLLRAAWLVRGARVELRADVLVAGFASRALGQVPCEDVAIRFPVPESWIYLFRVEKHFRYGSVKSAHRRTGKIKGIERFLGAVDTLQESLIEVTSGQAKYEHQHRAVVWRMPRLPKEGQGAYTTHNLVMRLALTSFDQVPAELAPAAHVSFSMPATQVSHVTIRSVALPDHDGEVPEKYVRYLARHEYIVGIERTSGESPAPAYVSAARSEAPPAAPATPATPAAPAAPSSDSDSD